MIRLEIFLMVFGKEGLFTCEYKVAASHFFPWHVKYHSWGQKIGCFSSVHCFKLHSALLSKAVRPN